MLSKLSSKQLALAWIWKTTQVNKVNPEDHELTKLAGSDTYDRAEVLRFINAEVAKLHERAEGLLAGKDLLDTIKNRSEGL